MQKYCKTSGLPVDDLINEIIKRRIKIDDIIEGFQDPNIIRYIPNSVNHYLTKRRFNLLFKDLKHTQQKEFLRQLQKCIY